MPAASVSTLWLRRRRLNPHRQRRNEPSALQRAGILHDLLGHTLQRRRQTYAGSLQLVDIALLDDLRDPRAAAVWYGGTQLCDQPLDRINQCTSAPIAGSAVPSAAALSFSLSGVACAGRAVAHLSNGEVSLPPRQRPGSPPSFATAASRSFTELNDLCRVIATTEEKARSPTGV